MANKEEPKLYVVRKFIKASSAVEALMMEKDAPVSEVYIDPMWMDKNLAATLGLPADSTSAEDEGSE